MPEPPGSRLTRVRPLGRTVPAVILAEERELETVTHLGMVAIGLRLEEVVARHPIVVGNHLPVLLWAEELFLHEHALRPAVVALPDDVRDRRPAAAVGDLPQHTPHMNTLHVRGRCRIKLWGEIPMGTAKVDVLLDG